MQDRNRQSPPSRGGWPKTLLAAIPALLLASAAAQAGSEAVEASYRLTSATAQADGSYAASFDFTFTNTGLADFSDLRVRLVSGPPYQITPGVSLEVGPLAIGETAMGAWEIRFDAPIEADVGLEFLGEADDAAGTARYLPVVIREEETAR